jgi:RNA polymerase sigma factor (sigma-70 family)
VSRIDDHVDPRFGSGGLAVSRGQRSAAPAVEASPLEDSSRWADLITGVRPRAFLVVIAALMGRGLRDQCSPEDIWQETLIQAWHARETHRWQGSSAFRGWLFEIARNRIRDAARRIETEKRGSGRPGTRLSELESQLSGSASAVLPPDSATPSAILMRAERTAAIERALASLPPELEPVVRMHLVEELTMDVIAKRQGVGVSTAWRRFRRGAELCSRALSERGVQPVGLIGAL